MSSKLIFFIGIVFNLTYAQEVKFVGRYELAELLRDSGFELNRSITLNADDTFEFYNRRKIDRSNPPTTETWGKGKWKAVDGKIHFSTDEENDIDDKYSLNFNNTKARYKEKSPRDLSSKVVRTSLIFYESDIPILKKHELIKMVE